jgi:ParB family chromosome partitioning protein
MATTQSTLEALEPQLDESIGVRQPKINRPRLSPVAATKDVGRRPLRNVGRIKLDQVIPDPSQPRKEFSLKSIDGLASSLRSHGQLAPIRVRWSATDHKWVIVYGERRWRAARAANLEMIDCYFDESDSSEAEILEQQLIENLLREDLSPIDQARGFSTLMDLKGWNGKQVAESLHVPASAVSRALALLDLPEDIQQKVDSGDIAARSAYEISKVGDNNSRRELAEMATGGMTVSETREAVQNKIGKKPKPNRKEHSAGVALKFPIENGLTVTVTSNRKVNYHEILEAIQQAEDEVQHRINNNVQLY